MKINDCLVGSIVLTAFCFQGIFLLSVHVHFHGFDLPLARQAEAYVTAA